LTAQGVLPFQKTKPGFFARDYKKEDLVDNTLTIKNDGTETLVKKWKDPDRHQLILGPIERSARAPIAGQSYPGASYGTELRGRLPAMQPPTSIANVGMPDISNQRAMYHALRRPHPQVAGTLSIPQQTQQNIWGSRFVPNPASMIRKDMSAPEDLPVGMDEEQWKFILDRIYGGNY
jgi:hypothetical protein